MVGSNCLITIYPYTRTGQPRGEAEQVAEQFEDPVLV